MKTINSGINILSKNFFGDFFIQTVHVECYIMNYIPAEMVFEAVSGAKATSELVPWSAVLQGGLGV